MQGNDGKFKPEHVANGLKPTRWLLAMAMYPDLTEGFRYGNILL